MMFRFDMPLRHAGCRRLFFAFSLTLDIDMLLMLLCCLHGAYVDVVTLLRYVVARCYCCRRYTRDAAMLRDAGCRRVCCHVTMRASCHACFRCRQLLLP